MVTALVLHTFLAYLPLILIRQLDVICCKTHNQEESIVSRFKGFCISRIFRYRSPVCILCMLIYLYRTENVFENKCFTL